MLMFLLIVGVLILCIFNPKLRCAITNPFKTVSNALRDAYRYFKHREWNKVPRGEIMCFTGLFGKGKTLSMVHEVHRLYKHYNGKLTWNKEAGKLLPNKFIILSNFDMKMPYIPFESMEQFVKLCRDLTSGEYPEMGECNYNVIACIDEASSVLNSRSFTKNFNPTSINAFMQVRKFNCNLFMSSQRFQMVDLLARSVCTYEIRCDKTWRLQKQTYIDAWDAENAVNAEQLKPVKRKCFFVTDKDYNRYNTNKIATDIAKAVEEGKLATSAEVISVIQPKQNTDTGNYKKSFLKRKIGK